MANPKLLNEKQVDEEYGLTVAWLRRHRLPRTGPPYLKLGGLVRYRREAIEAYLAENTIATTEEGGR